jgi:hypothetical protein
MLGNDVEQGLLPSDIELLARLVKDVCFRNARGYFGFDWADAAVPRKLTHLDERGARRMVDVGAKPETRAWRAPRRWC